MGIFIPILIIVISAVIIWRSTDGFELASDFLGRRLTKGIKGATINAVASSMPEFLSTIFFLFYIKDSNGFSGGIGITGGSAVFNILIIPISIYLVLLWTKKISKIPVHRKVFLRDGLILFVMTGFVAWVVHEESLNWRHGALLTAPYLGYMVYLYSIQKKASSKDESFEYEPVDGKINCIDIITLNLEKYVLRGKMIRVTNAWVLLVVSILVMVLGTWLLVHGTYLLGEELEIPLLFVAVVLSAAASSIPDTMISIRDAKKGNYEDAFSNALGSNIFDISFALGFPLLIYTLLNGSVVEMDPDIVTSSSDLWLVLFVITGLTLLIFTIGKYLNIFKIVLLSLIYVSFIVFVGIDYFHEIDFIGMAKDFLQVNYLE